MKNLEKYLNDSDRLLIEKLEICEYLGELDTDDLKFDPSTQTYEVHAPTEDNIFLHEAAVIEHKGILYASWYNCPKLELCGRTPIRGRRSADGGVTWSGIEVIADDESGKILYCPPVYGICGGRLYMFVNEMVAPDHIHALDLFILNEETDRFELLWSRPIPHKLNTNVVKLPNGKLMLPGRLAELDGFPNTPSVLISDSGRIDAEWRIVKIAENGDLPNGKKFEHPEITPIIDGETIHMFSRNDHNHVTIAYTSHDCGETWSKASAVDLPFASSKIYSGTLSNGRNYIIANLLPDRKRLAILFTEPNSMKFTSGQLLQAGKSFGTYNGNQWSYPCAYEYDGKLFVIYSAESDNFERSRGAVMSVITL